MKQVYIYLGKFLGSSGIVAMVNAISNHFNTTAWEIIYAIFFFTLIPYALYQGYLFAKLLIRLKFKGEK